MGVDVTLVKVHCVCTIYSWSRMRLSTRTSAMKNTLTFIKRASGSFSPWLRASFAICLLACLAPHADTFAQQSARDIIPQLQQQFGLNEGQVRGALGALLVFAREELTKVDFDALAQRIPNADAAMHEVKMRGVVTGPIDDRDEYEDVLVKLGVAEQSAPQFAPAVLDYLAAAGYERERDMLARVFR
jgi:Protein of unknown function VcgC/VcgE (DUF2780)